MDKDMQCYTVACSCLISAFFVYGLGLLDFPSPFHSPFPSSWSRSYTQAPLRQTPYFQILLRRLLSLSSMSMDPEYHKFS
jgi:hypothetical protein